MDLNISSKPKALYCILVINGKFLSKEYAFNIDFGSDEIWPSDYAELKNIAAEVTKFVKIIDAINYMALNGWEFAGGVGTTIAGGNTNWPLKYLMKYSL
jgi:hypothetical protein